MDWRGRIVATAVLLLLGGLARATDSPVAADAPLSAELQVIELEAGSQWLHGNHEAALPLYERLARERPQNAMFAERYAWCLLVRFEGLPTGPERTATLEAARREGNRARSLDDHSDLMDVLLERVNQTSAATNTHSARMAAAEAAFHRGEFDKALAGYLEIAASDPHDYEAHLFAGDAYFSKHEWEQAGIWFQKAIDIDPNTETAYRYWGDALLRSGHPEEALAKLIDGIVADPYTGRSFNGLRLWANATGSTLAAPAVHAPAVPDDANGGRDARTVTVTPEAMHGDPNVTVAWLAYLSNRAKWRSETFAKRFPDEKVYRHSLPEEVESLQMACAILALNGATAEHAPDAGTAQLLRLGRDGLLEAYVLLGAPDAGVAHDYRAYRDAHAEDLRRYLLTYVVQRVPPPGR